MAYLIDTDIIIFALRGDKTVLAKFEENIRLQGWCWNYCCRWNKSADSKKQDFWNRALYAPIRTP